MKDFPNCRDCPLRDKTYVPPEGPRSAKIVIIGEAPGENEEKEGRPFIGGAGGVLDMCLNRAGLSRKDIYITNVLKCRPPGNKIKSVHGIEAYKRCQPMLIKELANLNPMVVVPMGNTALQALGYNYKIGESRGFIMDSDFGKVIPTWHPAYIMRQWQEVYTADKDWEKIKRHSITGNLDYYRENYNVTPTIDDVELFAIHVNTAVNLGDEVRLGVDIETYLIDNPLTTPIKVVGFALDEERAIVVPFFTQSGNLYWQSRDHEVRAIQAIGSVLDNPKITKMAHNGLFDFLVLMNCGWDIAGPIIDTMIAQYLIYHLSAHSLSYLASIYADYFPWKLLENAKDDRSFRTYNARDCTIMQKMWPSIELDLYDNGLTCVFATLMDTILPTCRMMLNGIPVSRDRLREVGDRLTVQLDNMINDMSIMTGTPGLNPNSPKQLRDVLFNQMKLKSAVKTNNGKGKDLSTDDAVLKKLCLRYPDNRFIDILRDYRKLSKQYSTYVKKAPDYILEDGRIHTTLKLHRVVTGRYASTDPNMLALPMRSDPEGYIRGLYQALPGRMIVEADISQAELYVYAVLANDEIWLDAFAQGKDIHAINANSLIGYYDKKYRTFIKNFIYGLIYGSEGAEVEKVAPKELMQKITIREMMERLKQEHPCLIAYKERIIKQIEDRKYVINAFGRRRWYVNKPTKADIRSAVNFPIQSTVSDVMHGITPELDEQLQYPVDKIIMLLHDSFYVETDEKRTDIVAGHLKRIMEKPVSTPTGYVFHFKVDINIGKSLSKTEMVAWNKEN